jgi:hypothetical protein
LLFDLKTDLAERNDLAAQHPELVLKLKRRIVDWERDVDQKPVSSTNNTSKSPGRWITANTGDL